MTLEQYYTEAKIGERLVSLLPDFSPARCVELSAGEGALLIPVVNKWTDIEVTTCEIDSINHAKLERDFSGDHYNLDVISSTFESMVTRYEHAFDLAVSNPPFSWRENNNYEKEVLSRFNLDFMLNWKRVRSEVVFILQNLRLVKPSGFLAIILPELIVCSRLFSTFRKELLNYCSIHAIFEIERGAFKRTEAKTYIVVLRNQKVEGVYNFHDADGMVCERPQSKFAEIELNKSIREQEFSESPLFTIERGRHTGKELRLSSLPYYHTTGFFDPEKSARLQCLSTVKISGKKPVVANARDFLVHRVGSRALGKATVVEAGNYIISDCVFRISLPLHIDPFDVMKFWHEQGEWLKKAARGTCAKYLITDDVNTLLENYFIKRNNDFALEKRLAIA